MDQQYKVFLVEDSPAIRETLVSSVESSDRIRVVGFAEGADLGSGVTLEEIKPKTAVLRFRGARYTVGF